MNKNIYTYHDISYSEKINSYEPKIINDLEKFDFRNNYLLTLSTVNIFQKPNTEEYELLYSINSTNIYIYFCRFENSYMIHKSDSPAIIQRDQKYNTITYECHYRNGLKHNSVGPAEFLYAVSGPLQFQAYYIDGLLHNENGPATTMYSSLKTNRRIEKYFYKHKLHREDGPALISYNDSGQILDQYWYKHDKPHRLNGPAFITQKTKSWYVNGVLINRKKYPVVENDQIYGKVKLTKNNIIKATLFDREYGTFLKEMYDKNEKE